MVDLSVELLKEMSMVVLLFFVKNIIVAFPAVARRERERELYFFTKIFR
jgi:hypothetical protein